MLADAPGRRTQREELKIRVSAVRFCPWPFAAIQAFPQTGGPMVDPKEQAVVVVHGRGDGFAQEITAGRHRLIADEPVSAGGTDRGLGPYDLLLAGLGA